MIIEFCKYGSVESCYKNKKLTDEVKLLMCYDCAMGMNVSFFSFLFVCSIIVLLIVIEIGSFVHSSHPSSVSAPKRHHPPRLEARQPFGGLLLEGQELRPREAVRLWDEPFRDSDDADDGVHRHACVYGAGSVRRHPVWQKERRVLVRDDRVVDIRGKDTVFAFLFLPFCFSFYVFIF